LKSVEEERARASLLKSEFLAVKREHKRALLFASELDS